ncbi:MAG: hypothetical protein ABFS45_06530 [Pseudomonadota bacterium]
MNTTKGQNNSDANGAKNIKRLFKKEKFLDNLIGSRGSAEEFLLLAIRHNINCIKGLYGSNKKVATEIKSMESMFDELSSRVRRGRKKAIINRVNFDVPTGKDDGMPRLLRAIRNNLYKTMDVTGMQGKEMFSFLYSDAVLQFEYYLRRLERIDTRQKEAA